MYGLLFASCQGRETSSSPVERPLLADYDVELVATLEGAKTLWFSSQVLL